jgi:hypothetical protein
MFADRAPVCYVIMDQFENIWLRTKRKDAKGKTVSATGGVCYIFFPVNPAPTQHAVLSELGIV